MKHKIIYIVLLTVTIQLPASSNECGKTTSAAIPENTADATTKSPAVAIEETSMMPVSPFSRLLLNL